jgi:hypothetical protein
LPNDFIDSQGGRARLLLDMTAAFFQPLEARSKFLLVLFGQAGTSRFREFFRALNHQHQVIH